MVCIRARLQRLLKKSEKQIPRGLKSARDDKNKELATAQLKLCPFKAALNRVFQQPLKPGSFGIPFGTAEAVPFQS
jgi:hypothetical protein